MVLKAVHQVQIELMSMEILLQVVDQMVMIMMETMKAEDMDTTKM